MDKKELEAEEMMGNKLVLEGELFILVEKDDEGTHICAEINGINLWDWLVQNNGEKIKVSIEGGKE